MIQVNRWLYLLYFPALLLAGACSSHVSSAPEPIHFGLSTPPVTLDPRYATDAESYRICRLLYRSLSDFHSQYKAAPELAEWQQLGARHYRFHLGRDGRLFHNGQYLEGRDVKATYESILRGSPLSPHRSTLQIIDTIQLINKDTVDFFLHAADPLFPEKLTIGILPAALIAAKHPFHTQPIGSGRLRLVDGSKSESLELERVRDGQRILFTVARDPAVRVMKLLRGELDLVQGNIPPELVHWTAARHGIQISRLPGNNFAYLGFNMNNPVTGDQDIRKAIAHAIDRAAIIQHVFRDRARKAEGILDPKHWAAAGGLEPHRYDPEQARAHVHRYRERRNIPADVPIRIAYKTSNNPFRLRLATIIQAQLKPVGIQIDIRSYDWGTFYGDIKKGHFQMYSLSWVGIKSPDIFRYAFHSEEWPPKGANRGRLNAQEVDALIDAAEQYQDLQKKAAHYQKLQTLLHERLVYVPLWRESQFALIRDTIHGYRLHPDGNYDALFTISRRRP